MAYLDVSPMIAALRDTPSDFDMSGSQLRHMPSGHKVVFDAFGGAARIDAQCACTTLRISLEQTRDLFAAFRQWKQDYWRGVEINRDFADHFQPGLLRRFCVWALNYLLDHPHPLSARPAQRRTEQSAT